MENNYNIDDFKPIGVPQDVTLRVNKVLYTKDGRIMGNAFIIDKTGSIYTIKTDYGNILALNEKQINELFYLYKSEEILKSQVKYIEDNHKFNVKTP